MLRKLISFIEFGHFLSKINIFPNRLTRYISLNLCHNSTIPPFVTSSASQFLKNKTHRLESSVPKFWPRFHPFSLSRTEGTKVERGLDSYLGRDVGRDVLAAGIKLWSAQGSGDTTMLAGNKHTHTPVAELTPEMAGVSEG